MTSVMSQILSQNCNSGMWTELTNLCRFRSQNCWKVTSLEV